MVPIPIDDDDRLAALETYAIVGSAPSLDYDTWAELARRAFNAQYAAISFVERNRQWFKARCAVKPEWTPRDVAFCAYTILTDKPLVVEDALLDQRFRHNVLVTGDPYIRFYAGMPLITPEGYGIGSICVFDPAAKTPSPLQMDALKALRDCVMIKLDLSRLELEQRHGAPTESKPRALGQGDNQRLTFLAHRLESARGALSRNLAALQISQRTVP